jgi:pimeloyl-ACP methyl ester carboxylesterase
VRSSAVPIERVVSADCTPIAVERVGAGEPLVLVHGATVDRGSWRVLVPLLAERFECWVVDRRGRGDSGDAAAYDPQREVEDLQAVFAHVGRPLDLFGHSSGAVLALEAAHRSPTVRRLVLYEPPMRVDGAGPPGSGDFLPRLEALLAAGDRAGAVRAFYLAGPGITEEQLARMETGRSWPATVAMAHTIPYDVRTVAAFNFDRTRVAQVRQPTLILYGSASPPRDHRVAEALRETLPEARVVTLEGQGHRAMATAPDLLAKAVTEFLAG